MHPLMHRYGVDFDVAGKSFNGQDPIEVWPRQARDDQDFSRIRINRFYGRFGNNFYQIVHATMIAVRLNVKVIVAPKFEFATDAAPGNLNALYRIYDPDEAFDKELTGVFYAPYGFEQLVQTFSNRELYDLISDIRENLYGKLSPLPMPAAIKILALHFRSGDVFQGESVPTWYVQPPASFYIKSVEHALSEYDFDMVDIVFEDKANPAIDVVIDYLERHGISYNAEAGTLLEDIRRLMRAHTLVFSFSSFIETIAVLSVEVRRAYAFRTFCSQSDFSPFMQTRIADIMSLKNIKLMMVEDMTVTYIPPKTWARDGWQLCRICDFPQENLRVFPLQNQSKDGTVDVFKPRKTGALGGRILQEGSLGIEAMGPPPEIAIGLRDLLGLNSFVETGTLDGHTAIWASDNFSRVVTIEASSEYHGKARERFVGRPNIRAILGDSAPQLFALTPSLPPTLFFLDAHWSGGQTAGVTAECPLLMELGAIAPWFSRHAIIVDDARYFLKPPPEPHNMTHWPSLDEIADAMRGTAFMFHHRDTLVLVPRIHRIAVSNMLRNISQV